MFYKRLEKGKFVWPSAKGAKVSATPAQLSMLLERIDRHAPQWTWQLFKTGKLYTNSVIYDSDLCADPRRGSNPAHCAALRRQKGRDRNDPPRTGCPALKRRQTHF